MSRVEISKAYLRQAQQDDPIIGEVLKYVTTNHWPKGRKLMHNKGITVLVTEKQKLHFVYYKKCIVQKNIKPVTATPAKEVL